MAAALAAAGRTSTQPASALPTSRVTVLTLLADNELLAVSANSAAMLGSVRLGPAPQATRFVARLMALSSDGKRLVVLVSSDKPGDNRVVFVDARTLQIHATVPLLRTDVTYRGLALGSKTGRIYLFGKPGRRTRCRSRAWAAIRCCCHRARPDRNSSH